MKLQIFKIIAFVLCFSSIISANEFEIKIVEESFDGKVFQGGLEVIIPDTVQVYTRPIKTVGELPKLEFKTDQLLIKTELILPEGIRKEDYSYYKNHVKIPFLIELKTNTDFLNGNLSLTLSACSKYCFQEKLSVPIQIENSSASILIYLFYALVGGLFLNFMPCILPVLFLKITHLVSMNKENKLYIRNSIFGMVCGSFLFFYTIFILSIILKYVGVTFGWGLHFQNPYFLSFFTLFTFIWGILVLIDFKYQVRFSKKIHNLQSEHYVINNLIFGFTSSIFATPCSAPFLSTALTYLVPKPISAMLLIYTFISIGFTLPYIIIGMYPRFISFFPKPGKWILYMKKLSGIVMISVSMYFFYILFQIIFNSYNPHHSDGNYLNYNIKIENNYSFMLIHIKADWCLTCRANDKVLEGEEMKEFLKKNNIQLVSINYDINDEFISSIMKKHNSYFLPLAILRDRNGNDILLPTVISKYKLEMILNR